jgi:LCP family protein required for cell wall assembly
MWKRFLGAMAAIVVLTASGTATAILLEFDDAVDAFNRFNQQIVGVEEVLDDVDGGDPQTILVLGSDRRYADKAAGIKPRSDTIILVRLDPSKGATAVLSIPRDLKVKYRGPNGEYTDKINAAYSIGGPRATISKVKQLMEGDDGEPFKIHHVVNINFGAFRKAVDKLGCFYVDIDRRYFNDNRPPVQSPTNYATIDIKPGYQKLCGQDSLDFVRFRHLDTDIVRGARQQHYLSAAKDQVGVDRVFRDREQLLELFGRYTDTDIRSELGGACGCSSSPTSPRATAAPVSSTSSSARSSSRSASATWRRPARSSERRGVGRPRRPDPGSAPSARGKAPAPGGPRARPRRRRLPGRGPGGHRCGKVPFPVYYPKAIRRGARYWDGFEGSAPRTYDLFDEQRRKHRAYRMVVEAPGIGEYYGIQGTDWMDPPIIANPSETRTVGGRRLLLFRDGSRLRMVAWKTDNAVYWVTNTLLRSLTNRQMLGIARSLTRVGSSG